VNNRTGIINQAHDFLLKFGIIFPVGYAALELVSALMENHGLPIRLRNAVERMLLDIQRLTRDIKAIDVKIKQRFSEDAAGIHLLSIPGIGPLTASALAASVGDAATRAHATLPLHSGGPSTVFNWGARRACSASESATTSICAAYQCKAITH
jgi:transposase